MSNRSRMRFGFHLSWMCMSAVAVICSGLAAGGDHSLAAAASEVVSGRIITAGIADAPLTRVRPDLVPMAVAPPRGGGAAANPVLNVLRSNPGSLSQRQVFTVVDGETKRVDEQAAKQLGSRIELTAELLPNAVTKAAPAPAAVTTRFNEVSEVFVLPTRYTATAANGARAVSFNVLLAVASHLNYNGMTKGFTARIVANLQNPDNPTDASQLAQEVPVAIVADGVNDLMPLKFRQLNEPQQLQLNVAAPNEPYSIRAVTALDQNADPITVNVVRPEIRIAAVNNPIRGFGLEAVQINIEVDKAGPIDGEVISLRASEGTIEPGSVALKSGFATASLRSSGLASSTITASRVGFANGTQTVDFVFPVIFTIATLTGGLIGAIASLLVRGAGSWPRTILIGVIAAFVVVTGQVVGIQIGGWSAPAGVTGDALFFVLAALAGFAGEKVFNTGGAREAN